jgi:hypothetical protein
LEKLNSIKSDIIKNELSYKWLANGRSIKGLIHDKSGMPNQDSIKWIYSQISNSIIMAIADGHGSTIHFRSKTGSRFAVTTAIETIDKFFKRQTIEFSNISQYKDVIRYSLPKILVHNLIDKVTEHVQKFPFTQQEIRLLIKKIDNGVIEKLLNDPKIAYGSTLIVAVLIDKFIIFFQIGDGNILTVNNIGNIICPLDDIQDGEINPSSVISLNQTASLSMNNSWSEFKTRIYNHYDIKPELILLTTDGYSNSFNNNRNFQKIGTDYLEILKKDGYIHVIKNLKKILKETSARGSGDDITLGFLYKLN